MKLARVFQDYMVLQRGKPILIWGTSEKSCSVEVRINNAKICEANITKGNFSFLIPQQQAAEDATLQIGDICFSHVDIGEVWVAGGQSNMEFPMDCTKDCQQEIESANDIHLRTYIVGQYSFEGEREEGNKLWRPWDKWLTYETRNARELPATAIHFAKELRKQNVPVGILSCNWGGTPVMSWLDRALLENDQDLKCCTDEFDAMVAKLDLEQYEKVKKIIRPIMASKETEQSMMHMRKFTFTPQQTQQMTQAINNKKDEDTAKGEEINPLGNIPMELITAVGPKDAKEPAALYNNMVKEIIGYSVKGVIWYQGESDESRANIYAKLFSTMIACWRNEWKAKNSGMAKMPFVFVQLAPFGVWRECVGANFPVVRKQQEIVANTVEDAYMASISDIGNVFDIHPKIKSIVGQRLALLALKYVYNQNILADAPHAKAPELQGDKIVISFENGQGLSIVKQDFTSYNGFDIAEIPADLCPPITDGINGLEIVVDGVKIDAECKIEGESLIIFAKAFKTAQVTLIKFAQTGFYQVNIFNSANIPAKPFEFEIK